MKESNKKHQIHSKLKTVYNKLILAVVISKNQKISDKISVKIPDGKQ